MNFNTDKNQDIWYKKMSDLKLMHSYIAELIGDKKVAFLDCPVYFNFGDLLIWHGTEQFFKEYGINVVYRSEASYVKQSELNKCDIILYQGGGNFGDLYPRVQKMREQVLLNNTDKRIICMPQTIHFSNESTFNDSAKKFKKHSDFHMLVRDKYSEEIANKFTKNVRLMPDMAHSLHPLVHPTEVGGNGGFNNILFQHRDDGEKGKFNANSLQKRAFDWNDLVRVEDKIVRKSFHMLSKLGLSQNKLIPLWRMKSNELEIRAISYFEPRSYITTDRLHGMILSSLLGKQCNVYDNSYGKNSSYYEQWLQGLPYIKMND